MCGKVMFQRVLGARQSHVSENTRCATTNAPCGTRFATNKCSRRYWVCGKVLKRMLGAWQALPHWEDVAAGVLSHVAGHDKRVCDVAKDLHRRLKAGHSARVPVVRSLFTLLRRQMQLRNDK